MNTKTFAKKISRILRNISQPARIRILLEIGEGEACVCHLETILGYRQAYISQHMMALRKAGLLDSRRDGRFIFFQLRDIRLLTLIRTAASLAGIAEEKLASDTDRGPLTHCSCPECAPALATQ